jgi:zeaxanthin epoxidase
VALVGALAGGLSVAGFLRASKRTARSGAKAQKASVVRQAVANEISEENPLRVIIAGGGVGGLLLAKALTKEKHVKVNLLEQTSQFARFGGPIQIASNALSVIRAVDETLFNTLMEKFTFTGCRRNGLVDALRTEWYCPFDAMETSADYFELPYTGVVDRPDLQDILLESLPEGTLTNSKKVTKYNILDDAQGVEVTCEDGSVHEGDVYIGADGIWSATRSQMWNEPKKGPGSGCTYSGYVVFAGESVYKPEDYFDVGYKVYMGPKRYFVTSDVGRGRIQWYAFISMAENAQVPEDKTEKKEFIRSAFQGWSQQVLDLVDATPTGNVEDRALYDRPPSLTKSWADGPVAMMGDAVHPMMPNLGQGGCQAMEDAFAILERFQTVKRRTEVPDLLQDYYRSRVIRASAIQGLSRIASDLLLSTFTFPWKPEEGLSGPYGKGMGDFNSDAVIVNYLKYLLPTIFNVQFSFLYSYHPYKWTAKEVKELVGTVMDRHRVQAEEAWEEREKKVIDGSADSEDATVGASFFAKVASTA